MRYLLSTFNTNPKTDLELKFCEDVLGMPWVTQLLPVHAVTLREYLKRVEADDPYAVSEGYYLATGRRGAWLYSRDRGDLVVFCLHPNIRDRLLIFSPNGYQSIKPVIACVDTLRNSGLHLSLARIPSDPVILDAIRVAFAHLPLCIETESELDWKYPVCTVNSKALAQLKGGELQKIRQALNRHGSKLIIRQIRPDSEHDVQLVRSIARRWSQSTAHKHRHRAKDDCNDCLFERLLSLASEATVGIRGFYFLLDESAIGFTFVSGSECANLLASQVVPNPTNLSECVISKTAIHMLDCGSTRFCLGGSETAGMNQFKHKFNPAWKISLRSGKIAPFAPTQGSTAEDSRVSAVFGSRAEDAMSH